MTQIPPPPDDATRVPDDPEVFTRMQGSAEFTELRSTFRRFAFPLTVFFLLWYLLYVLLSTYAVGFMSTRVFGNVNVGLLMGLGQFVTTFVITGLYVRHANRRVDPLAERLRLDLEGGSGLEGHMNQGGKS